MDIVQTVTAFVLGILATVSGWFAPHVPVESLGTWGPPATSTPIGTTTPIKPRTVTKEPYVIATNGMSISSTLDPDQRLKGMETPASISFTIYAPSGCNDGQYRLTFGDGTTSYVSCSGSKTIRATHTYTTIGTFIPYVEDLYTKTPLRAYVQDDDHIRITPSSVPLTSVSAVITDRVAKITAILPSTCDGAKYTLSYGDGSPSSTIDIPVNDCQRRIVRTSHPYSPGTYTITLTRYSELAHIQVTVK